MAYNSDHGVNLGILKDSLTRAKTEWLAAIAKTGHASFQKVDAVPEAESSQTNILYLVMNDETSHYDIYAKVDNEMVLLDDTTVDLSNYVQKDGDKVLSDNNYTDAEKSKLAGIAEGANNYVHPSHTAQSEGFYKVTVDNQGHVTAVTAVTKEDITGLGIPGQDTTYQKATAEADGLMSKEHFAKLEGMVVATDGEVTEMLNEVFPTA